MAKLDEIAELLTEEIRGFENSVGRLEKLQRELKAFRIEPDTSGIDFILKRYNDHQIKAIEEQYKLMGDVIHYIKNSMSFPKWSIKMFWGLLVCITLILGFSVYQVSQISEIKQEAFRQGEEKAVAHFREFGSRPRRPVHSTKSGENPKTKSRLHPIRFLLPARGGQVRLSAGTLQKPDRIRVQSSGVRFG